MSDTENTEIEPESVDLIVNNVNNTTEPEPELQKVDKNAGKKKRSSNLISVKMTEKQKKDLRKHMEKVGTNMTSTEKKSHRMKMMSQMRKGQSVGKAHKAIS